MAAASRLAALSLLIATASTPHAQRGAGAGRGAPAQGPNAIVGRVLNADGKPVPDVFVTALRPRTPDAMSARPFTFVSALLRSITDAQGAFRLDGLPIGDVYVVALPHNVIYTSGNQLNRSGYGKTFYPSAGEIKDAQTVTVTGTSPVPIDIRLRPARLALVTGTVMGESGQPVSAGGTLDVTHGDGLFGLDSRGVPIRANGAFAIPALQPETYFLEFHESTWPPPRGEIPKVSVATIVVSGSDLTNVQVVSLHMVTGSGRVVVDPAVRQTLQPAAITVGASPIEFDGNPGPQKPGALKDDLTFEFKTWPSKGRVRVSPEAAWTIKSIRLNGVDITGKPIDFVEGKVVTGLEIEIVPAGRGRW